MAHGTLSIERPSASLVTLTIYLDADVLRAGPDALAASVATLLLRRLPTIEAELRRQLEIPPMLGVASFQVQQPTNQRSEVNG